MNKIVISGILFVLISCNPFSNKEEKAEIERERIEQRKKEEQQQKEAKEEREFLVYTNKEFKYLCELISYETNISQDTVTIILKEYFIQKGNAVFDDDKTEIIKQKYRITNDDGNLVEEIIIKYGFPRKTLFLVYNEIDTYYKIKEIYYTLEDLEESTVLVKY